MSSYPLVKFVDSPEVSAVVRYDFNDQAATPAKKVTDFDPGVPTLEGDPDAVGQSFGFRSPSITHTIKGTKAAAMAALSAVSKELLLRTNWVLFQPSAGTQPVWFKTYRTGYQPITLDQVYVRVDGGGTVALPDTWKITIPLVAEAFTYGAREVIPTFQVIQAPADLAGPTRTAMRAVLPAIKGDAPTALRVALTPNASGNNVGGNSSWLLGCIAGTASMSDPVVDIGTGDTVTNVAGTAAAATDATYFGGSFRTVTIAAATPNLLTRFWMTLPNTIAIGRYKVLLRCRYTAGAATTLLFRLAQWPNGGSGNPSRGQTSSVDVFSSDTGRNLWVDLGEFQFPFGLNPPTDAGGTAPFPVVAIDIGTASGGASSVNVDSVKLIPVDGPHVTRATILKAVAPAVGGFASSGIFATFDGDYETCWPRFTSTGVYVESNPTLHGTFPIADPSAVQNLLLLMATDSGGGSASATSYTSALNAQAALDISYYPRFLHVGDGT